MDEVEEIRGIFIGEKARDEQRIDLNFGVYGI